MSKNGFKQMDAGGNVSGAPNSAKPVAERPRRRRRGWRMAGLVLVVLLLLGGVGRAMLPGLVRDYVNRTLERSTLYSGISNIAVDFLPRALQDPRVNWQRKGVTRGGISIHHGESVTWDDSSPNVQRLQKHFVQFIGLATGGLAHYAGKEIKSTHADMHISNAEFDATIGDLKATLDRLKIPNKEQKELQAVIESTRPEIVTER